MTLTVKWKGLLLGIGKVCDTKDAQSYFIKKLTKEFYCHVYYFSSKLFFQVKNRKIRGFSISITILECITYLGWWQQAGFTSRKRHRMHLHQKRLWKSCGVSLLRNVTFLIFHQIIVEYDHFSNNDEQHLLWFKFGILQESLSGGLTYCWRMAVADYTWTSASSW